MIEKRHPSTFMKGIPYGSMKVKRVIIRHIPALAAILILACFYHCPFYFVFHIPCPGCGMTRAFLRALCLDFKGAFLYHPLWPAAGAALFYLFHRSVLPKKLSGRMEKLLFGVICALFIAVYLIRLYKQSI